ncbi:MAG: caspase family protein [Spirochaetaceae bacterium]
MFSIYSQEENRLALVIGNADYSGSAKLKNPVNDAIDISEKLESIGWDVTLVLDADRRNMLKSITNFKNVAMDYENPSVLIYYAGHGMQIDGENYLLPIKTKLETVDDVKLDAVSLSYISEVFNIIKPDMSLLILDACRDNPFAKVASRSSSKSRGLSVVQVSGGDIGSAIIFATSPGDVALDGNGRNGVFTTSFLKYIDNSEKLEDMFRSVTLSVKKTTNNNQIPWISASLSSSFYLVSSKIREARAKLIQAEEDKKFAEQVAEAASIAIGIEALKTAALLQNIELAKEAIELANSVLLESSKLDKAEAEKALEIALESKLKAEQRAESSILEAQKLSEEAKSALLLVEKERLKIEELLKNLGPISTIGSINFETAEPLYNNVEFMAKKIKPGRESFFFEDNKDILLIDKNSDDQFYYPTKILDNPENFTDLQYELVEGYNELPRGSWLLTGRYKNEAENTFYKLVEIFPDLESKILVTDVKHTISYELNIIENRLFEIEEPIKIAKRDKFIYNITGYTFLSGAVLTGALATAVAINNALIKDDYHDATTPMDITDSLYSPLDSALILDLAIPTAAFAALSYYFFKKSVLNFDLVLEKDALSLRFNLLNAIVKD